MTRSMMRIGFAATALIVVLMLINAINEPARQSTAEVFYRDLAVAEGTELYVQQCAVCHGTSGQGIGSVPPLASEGQRGADYETIFRTIERGRYNTAMAAYGAAEGGIFTDAQIDSLVALIQYGSWQRTAERADALGIVAVEAQVLTLSDELLAQVRALPQGEQLASGLSLYAETCAACHGGSAEGTSIAPPLNTDELRARLSDSEIKRIIEQGVVGTLMAGWSKSLATTQIDDMAVLIRDWPAITQAGIELPVLATPRIDMSPAAVAAGKQLFTFACANCHGADANGSRMAPALNDRTFLSQTNDAAIQQIIAGGVAGTMMPAWGGRLTEADIAAITAYLRSLEATAPSLSPITDPGLATKSAPPWKP